VNTWSDYYSKLDKILPHWDPRLAAEDK